MRKKQMEFRIGEGLFCGEEYICDFEPLLKGIFQEVDESGKITESYDVAIRRLDGSETAAVRVKSLKQIQYYVYFKADDSELTTADHRKVTAYLKNQNLEIQKIRKALRTGLLSKEPLTYVFDAEKVLNISDEVLACDRAMPVFSVGESSHDELIAYVSRLLKLYPGVSDMLFLFELFSILKPLITNVTAIDIAGVVYGPPSSYKTAMAKLVSVGNEEQIIRFDDCNQRTITPVLQKYGGHTVVIDDYRFHRESQKRQKQQELADYLVRYSGTHGGAHVLLTAEFLEGSLSMQDRMVPVFVKKITDQKARDTFVSELNFLVDSGEMLWEIYWKFGRAVYENKAAVEDYFKQKLKNEVKGGRYRIERNVGMLMIVYNIFARYFAGEAFDQFDSQILDSLSEVKNRAEQHMRVVERMEKDPDWAREVAMVLPAYKARIAGTEYFYENDVLYVLPDTLKEYLEEALESVVSMKSVREDLFAKGILYADKSATLTVKRDGVGYYAIRILRLQSHVRKKYGENTK